jgi:hypothetical protein
MAALPQAELSSASKATTTGEVTPFQRETLPAPVRRKASAMRRYFYNALASYVALYVRPQDEIVEIDPRSVDLGERFLNYKAVSSVAELKSDRARASMLHLVKTGQFTTNATFRRC